MNKISLDTKSYELRYGNIPKLLFKYSIPAVISTLVVALYNIIDRIYIGHSLGAMAISGLALTLPISAAITAVGTLLGIGSSARISIVMGKKDIHWARNILCHYPILTLFFSGIFITTSMIYLDELLYMFGATDKTLSYAKDYLQIVIPFSIFTNLCFGFSHILRASGFPKKAMNTILIGIVLNMILDPIFLFVFKTGIEGVAIATAISMMVGGLYPVFHFMNKQNTISFHWQDFKLKKSIIRNILSIGFSPFIMNFVASGIAFVLNIQLAKYGGDYAIGAFGIIYSYQLFMALFVLGMSNAMQPIVGYNYGANNYKRVKDTMFLTLKIATYITIPFFIMAEFFPELLTKAFTNDPELTKYTVEAFRYSFVCVLFVGLPITISSFLLSIGRAGKSLFMSLLRQVIYMCPLIFILPIFFGINGVWFAISVSDFLAFITASLFLVSELKNLYKHKTRKSIGLHKVWKFSSLK